jgi:glutathione S-transferase
MTEKPPPIFYSFRRCPYAIRARLALASAGIVVELREVELRNKPEAMLAVSAKATVPVLVLNDGGVIDESLDIMRWALAHNDPDHWIERTCLQDAEQLIRINDGEFKYYLDRYKYADRYPEYTVQYYRQQGESFLAQLEKRLNQNPFLCGAHFSLADAAILPFIRQFAAVDSDWFESMPYPAIKRWLNEFIASGLFVKVMSKHLPWQPEDPLLLF